MELPTSKFSTHRSRQEVLNLSEIYHNTTSRNLSASPQNLHKALGHGPITASQINLSDLDENDSLFDSTLPIDVDNCITSFDRYDMSRMGKQQEMRRVFRQFSILSFTCVIMATWEFLLTANTQGLVAGGRAGLFWSYIWTICGFGLIIASMAEMASMAPTSGGQYRKFRFKVQERQMEGS